MPPLIKVYGHVRSGNHFFAEMVRRAFYSHQDMSLRVQNAHVGHWSRRDAPGRYVEGGREHTTTGTIVLPYGQLLGDHRTQPRSFTATPIPVYVYRDGRDVALSCHAWKRFRARADEELTFSEYIRRPLDWSGTPGTRVDHGGSVLFVHWREHVRAWLASGVLRVRYEDLMLYPYEALHRLGRLLGTQWQLDERALATDSGAVGWNPRDVRAADRLGRWRQELSPEDLDYFNRHVPLEFPGRWGDGAPATG